MKGGSLGIKSPCEELEKIHATETEKSTICRLSAKNGKKRNGGDGNDEEE